MEFASKCYGDLVRTWVKQGWRWMEIAEAEQPWHQDSHCLRGCLIFVHKKQFSNNKTKRSTEIKSKFLSSDPWSDPYLLPYPHSSPPPPNKHCCSCLFIQQASICMQMTVSIEEWKHCFSWDNISWMPSLVVSPALTPTRPPPPPLQPSLLGSHHVFISFRALNKSLLRGTMIYLVFLNWGKVP